MKINWPSFKKIKIGNHGAQLLIVVLGVFLGMLLTEWNASRKLNQTRSSILSGIKSELQTNKLVLQEALNNRKPFYYSYDSLLQLLTDSAKMEPFKSRSFNERLPNWKGVGILQLKGSMFETAKYSNVLAGTEIAILHQLSITYNNQEASNTLRHQFIQRFLKIDENTTYGTVLQLMAQIRQELGGLEILLIEDFSKSIELLESSGY